MKKIDLSWFPQTVKIFFEGLNDVIKNDKFLGFVVIVVLALLVSRLPEKAPQGVLEWYKMALSGIFGAIMGYSIGKRL